MSETHNRVVFNGISECSRATGLSEELLLVARERIKKLALSGDKVPNGLTGFHESNRIYWTPELSKWIEQNKAELETLEEGTREYWQTEKDKWAALTAKLEFAKEREKVVEKEAVHSTLKTIAAAQCSLLNSRFSQELAIRVNGKSVPDTLKEFDKVLNEVFGIMAKGVNEWS